MERYIIVCKNFDYRLEVIDFIKNALLGNIVDIPKYLQTFLVADLEEQHYQTLKDDNRVILIEKDQQGTLSNYSLFSTRNWGLDRIDQRGLPLDNRYRTVRNGFNVDIYVLDSGINFNHVDFSGRALPLFDAVNESGFPLGDDGLGHGTHVAAIIAGTVFGVAKQALIYSVKVANKRGSVSLSNAILGINQVISHHVNKGARGSVINFSINFSRNSVLDSAIQACIDVGIVVCASAGNFGIDAELSSPAGMDDVFTVGSVGFGDQYSSFSNFGPQVDIFAPGEDTVSAWPFVSTETIITKDSNELNIIADVPPGVIVKSIDFFVEEAFDVRAQIISGKLPDLSLAAASSGDLRLQGRLKQIEINQTLSQSQVTPLYAKLSQSTNNSGRVKITVTVEQKSNSTSRALTGTSMSAPFVSGVVALRLQEEASKLTTKSQVLQIKQSIINDSTKNIISNLPQNTPNNLLYAKWLRSNVVEWLTLDNNIAVLDEGEPLSVFVNAKYIDFLGNDTQNIQYSILGQSPIWGVNSEINIDSLTGEITWATVPPSILVDQTRTFSIIAQSTLSSAQAISTFSITVKQVPNKPPIWSTPNVSTLKARGAVIQLPGATEDIPYSFNLVSLDPEQQIIEYVLLSGKLPNGLTLNSLTGELSGTVTSLLVDTTYTFVIRSIDSIGEVSDITFSLHVIAFNDPPQWITLPGDIGQILLTVPFSFQLEAFDPDGDPIFYSLYSGSLPNGITLDSSGLISGVVVNVLTVGVHTFTVEVTDTVSSAVQTFNLEVLPATVNNPPNWITPQGSIGTLNELTSFSFAFSAFDIEGDPLQYNLVLGPGQSLPPGLVFNPAGVLSGFIGTVTSDTTFVFTIEVTDGFSAPIPRTFSLTVLNTFGVTTPVWLTPPGLLGEIWELFPSNLQVEAIDNAGLPLTFILFSGELPPGMELNTENGILFGTPDSVDENETFNFEIMVSNDVLTSIRAFSIIVLNILSKPSTNIIADRITGFNKLDIRSFVVSILGNKQNLLYRPGDPNFAIPAEFDVPLLNGIPLWPEMFNNIKNSGGNVDKISYFVQNQITPSDVFYSIMNDDIYKWLDVDEFVDPNYSSPLKIVKPADPEDINSGPLHIGGHHYKAKLVLGNLRIYQARGFAPGDTLTHLTGDVMYDVICVEILDPQQGGAFRPDLITYDEGLGAVVSQLADGISDPGVAYSIAYPDPFQVSYAFNAINTHPEYKSGYNADDIINNAINKNRDLGNPYYLVPYNPNQPQYSSKNTEALDFITPHSIENMRQHILEGYGGFVDDIELKPRWLSSEQIPGDPNSVPGWVPVVPIAYLKPNTALSFLLSLTREQQQGLSGMEIVIDRHLIYTTPVITPTTRFKDLLWPDGTTFDINETVFNIDNIVFDVQSGAFADCTFDAGMTTFDGISDAVFEKYVRFPAGDKYFDAMTSTIIHKLRKKMPALKIKGT